MGTFSSDAVEGKPILATYLFTEQSFFPIDINLYDMSLCQFDASY